MCGDCQKKEEEEDRDDDGTQNSEHIWMSRE